MNDSELQFDVAVCGAGPVGMTIAALMVKRGADGRRIALIDARALDKAVDDPRSIALAYGSKMLLDDAGAWPLPATAIHTIHVSRRGHLGRSLLDRTEHRLPALGYVAQYGDVVAALARACDRAGVTTIRPARVTGVDERADGVLLALEDGRQVRAQVAVQAEGGVFSEQGARALQRDYGQTGIIARVSVSAPVAHQAFERFTDEGPLALLPQDGPDGHQYALVWCVKPERAPAVLALDDAAFLAALGEAFGTRLGRFTGATARLGFPLGLNAEAFNTARTVAVGNAAQTMHPVAGQGMNLGLRDAAVLARALVQDGATPQALARFVAERQHDRRLTITLTDTLARVFTGSGPLQGLLGLGLTALDLFPPAGKLLAGHMMFGARGAPRQR